MNTKALYTLSSGLYVVGAKASDLYDAQVANTVVQLSSDPKLVSVCINKNNYTHELIEQGGYFSVSVLSQDAPMELIGVFGFHSGREVDKFTMVNPVYTIHGLPVLHEHCLGYLECQVLQSVDAATHTLYIGQLTDAAVYHQGEALTYAYYHEIKKGRSPKNAPTYRAEEDPTVKPAATGSYGKPAATPAVPAQAAADLQRYTCPICGYIYDPAEGDPAHDVPAGTSFTALPADWVCPVCSTYPSLFEAE
ncbi:MAG: flavin reductase [Oscillospiraceae bacterium]|nr:flavin reductase [Oscillospiraceae bacterium]MDD4368220.1 flavin reductase [Oscillospiraceae bacterium]